MKPSKDTIKSKKVAAAKQKAAAAAERMAAADAEAEKDTDGVDSHDNNPTLHANIVMARSNHAKDGDERLWTSLQVSPIDSRNEMELDKLRSHAR